ncbi:ArsR/SmtB family transcription factor [Nonomuraea muscovyensis]|uniref:DNA-binding transcriptional ArsR family regulator/rhodanese-related sulfurtransferase n=1 Tax=Nonomuraea muscovyensis TaxID=1124761 RepID=A0A7X0F318_9ACTN|nr:metalloregulator ArsR/SmtB family transcription factor [Nonomuraea muscovyensis]MBB6351201.1 DNA-binding transcriptional ArsR family regulator/rhodanese-related sulfurtransferase [Nonomuraea muscovyensis]
MTTVLAEFARVAKALANPVRLHLLDLLSQAERSVEDLAGAAKVPIGNTSAQLKVLRDAGLVCSRREGTRIYYRLAGEDVALLYANLRKVSRKRALEPEITRMTSLRAVPSDPAITREELLRRRGDGRTVLIDVRPAVEYLSAHIPGAVSIPLEELRVRMDEIPVGVEVVTYCRSSHCLLATEAVWLLKAHGRCARPLEEGMLEWRLHRLPVEAGRSVAGRARPLRPREYAKSMAPGGIA